MTAKQLEATMQRVLREETQDIRDDIKLIKHVQSDQGLLLRTLGRDMGKVKEVVNAQAVLLEDFESRFTAASEVHGS